MLKKNIFAAAMILLTAATVSCQQYSPSGHEESPVDVTPEAPEVIEYRDCRYSLVPSASENDTYKAVNYFSVLNGFYCDGRTDDSENLQKLLDRVSVNGGGSVYLPAGVYRLESSVNIPDNVTLTGDFISPRSSSGLSDCTVFIVGETESTLSEPLFVLNDGSSLTDVTVYYEGRTCCELTDYPYTVKHASGENALIRNFTVINASNGISLSSEDAKNVVLSDIYMTATDNGIYVLRCADKLTITNVFIDPSIWYNYSSEFSSDMENASNLVDKMSETLVGLTVSSTGDAYVDDVKINTCRIGVKTDIPYISEKTPLFSDITVNDASEAALLLMSAPRTGIAFAKCSFRTDDSYNSKDVEVENTFLSPTVFNSCSFRGSPSYSFYSEGSAMFSFVGCDFISWKESAIKSTDRIISASGGGFNSSLDLAELSEKTVGVFALNDLYAQYSREETVFIAETNNQYTVNRITDTWFEDLTTEFTLTDKVYYAVDYGITASSADNTVAMNMAMNHISSNGGGTLFVDAGTYNFSGEILVPKGVRIQGVGAHGTVLNFTRSESGIFLNLEGSNKLKGFKIHYAGTETPEEAAENPVKAIYSQGSNLHVSEIRFSLPHYALWLTDASNITLENLWGNSVTGGIYAERCDFLHISHVEFTKEGLSEEVVTHQYEKFVAVMIRECTGTLCENLSSDNGDYLIYLNSENVDVVPEEPTVAVKGLFAENVYSAFAINKYDFAAVVNVSADTAIYGKNAYHATTFAGNRGNLCVYNMIGKGDVTGGIYFRGGTVSVQSCIFNTCGNTAVKNEGATAEVIGCIIMDKSLKYHAEADSGALAFIANIINSDKEFIGADASYIRSYTAPEAAFTEEYNLIPIA